ncbi:hypothetical protein ITP31_003899 [Salmonella enterica]|uniref:hypothetical protein n=1 Tax=Serratia phage PCH45 TaxID=2608368 RepID=UPI0012A9B65F|nr:hypothetical protein [Salmonella enterica]QFP93126.1 hypothetical protein [Serratia phage PCH45]
MKNNFEITVQRGYSGQGNVKRLDNNYCQVVLGALEYPNSTGSVYDLESAIRIIEKSQTFNRRMKDSYLRGELGHPVERECRDYNDFVRRIHTIDERNVAIHIRRVWIDRAYVGPDGKKIIAILGEVAPSGPHAGVVERALNNPHENLAFSVRSLTNDRIVGGVRRKFFDNIITWDVVNEPGLSPANKFNSPSCESADVLELVRIPATSTLMQTLKDEQALKGIGMESAYRVSVEASIDAFEHRYGKLLDRRQSSLENW